MAQSNSPIYKTPIGKLKALTVEILRSRKYRQINLPEETIIDLLKNEMQLGKDERSAIKSARRKLHNIIAPYLGDLDYDQAIIDLESAFQNRQSDKIKQFCRSILAQHSSTRERLEILDIFYPRLFALGGKPKIILDLACGLNPFSLPWMNLDENIQYHAYDIHQPRIRLINRFFELYGVKPLAEVCDVLIKPPVFHVNVAFLFKEAHRMEQRRKGANRELLKTLDADSIFVSLPTLSLHGGRDLRARMRSLIDDTLKGLAWDVKEIEFTNELVFCINK